MATSKFFTMPRWTDSETFAKALRDEKFFKESGTEAVNLSLDDLRKWLRKNGRNEKFGSRKTGNTRYLDRVTFLVFFAEYQKGTSSKKAKSINGKITDDEMKMLQGQKDNPMIAEMLKNLESLTDEVSESEDTEN